MAELLREHTDTQVLVISGEVRSQNLLEHWTGRLVPTTRQRKSEKL